MLINFKKNRTIIPKKNKQDVNIKTHYKRDTNIASFTQYGLRPHKNFQSFIIIPSNKMEGYNPAALPLHTLVVSLAQPQRLFAMLSFYRGITMGKYYRAPNTMGLQTIGQQTSQKNSSRGFSPEAPFSWALPPHPPAGMSVQ